MSTKIATLAPSQWHDVYTLPADGMPYNIPGVAFRATHFAATRMKVEHVIAETQFGTLRRRLVNGKWQATEYIND